MRPFHVPSRNSIELPPSRASFIRARRLKLCRSDTILFAKNLWIFQYNESEASSSSTAVALVTIKETDSLVIIYSLPIMLRIAQSTRAVAPRAVARRQFSARGPAALEADYGPLATHFYHKVTFFMAMATPVYFMVPDRWTDGTMNKAFGLLLSGCISFHSWMGLNYVGEFILDSAFFCVEYHPLVFPYHSSSHQVTIILSSFIILQRPTMFPSFPRICSVRHVSSMPVSVPSLFLV